MTSIHVPYTYARQATRVYLLEHYNTDEFPVAWHDVSADKWAYTRYFGERWEQGQTFINFEHDVVPWPGAIESLMACPQPWCFFGYQADVDISDRGAFLGLAKLTDVLIDGTKDVWGRMRDEPGIDMHPQAWSFCDTYLYQEATKLGFTPHQHWPAVLNAHVQWRR